MDNTPEHLLKADEVGEMLNLSTRQIYRLEKEGKMPAAVHLSRSVRWLESEINAWLKAGTPDRQTWEKMKEQST